MKPSFTLLFIIIAQIGIAQAAGVSGDGTRKVTGDTDWKSIAYDGFSARMPDSSFKTWSDDKSDDGDELKYRMFSAQTERAWYFAFGFNKAQGSPIVTLLRFGGQRNATASDIVLDNVPGKRLKFTEVGSLQHEALIFLVGERVFIFHTVSLLGEASDVEQFLKSIHFEIEKSEIESTPGRALDELVSLYVRSSNSDDPASEIIVSDSTSDRTPPKPSILPKNSGGGMGSGSGSGVGTGSGSGSGREKAAENTDLRILSKVRPVYTDLARHYNLTGTTLLRVTFLADGNIGDVSVVKPIPLGLTENAIRAAKLMKFEPPRRNGLAYTVNKIVQYNFNLF